MLFDKIKNQSTTLNEVVNLRTINPNGIQTSKTNAYVFKPIREDDVYYYFMFNNKEWAIEKSITRPYYKTARGFEELNTFRSVVINAHLIFPYTIKGDKATLIPLEKLQSKYPKALEYFTAIKEILLDRKMSSNKNLETEWYRYGRSQNLTGCNAPIKIIVGNLSNGDKYAIDKQQVFVPAGGTAGYSLIILPQDVHYNIYYIQALLNSVQSEWFSLVYGDFFRGNFISRGTRFNGRLPFYKIDFENPLEAAQHDAIVERQKTLISLGDRIAAARNNARKLTPLKRQFELLKTEQQRAINNLYGMTDEEVTLIPNIKELYAAD